MLTPAERVRKIIQDRKKEADQRKEQNPNPLATEDDATKARKTISKLTKQEMRKKTTKMLRERKEKIIVSREQQRRKLEKAAEVKREAKAKSKAQAKKEADKMVDDFKLTG